MQQPSGGFRLIVRRGPQPNQIYELNKDVITLGRDITNDITINDPEVSRHHAKLSRQGDSYVIEDLGSTNGTFVNGQRLSGARLLTPGETVGLGETVTLAYESTAFPAAAQSGSPPNQVPASRPAAAAPVNPYAPPSSPAAAPQQQPQAGYYQQQPAAPAYEQRPPGYDAPPPQGYYGDQQAPQYAPYPDQPPSPYGYAEEPRGGGMGRWVLLGCGCFIVLCVIGAVIGVIVVDSACLWNEPPLSDVLDLFGLSADLSSNACQ